MAFNDATRREIETLPQAAMAAGGGNVVRIDIPRVGIASHIYLAIRGSVVNGATAPTGPNPLGYASLIQNVRVTANNGNDIFNMSGPGYHYLFRRYLDLGQDPLPQSNATSVINTTASATTPFNLDMIIPFAINKRDPLGLIMLQSDQSLLTLWITFANAATMQTANTGTWSCTVTPYIVFYTVPANRSDWPPFTMLHQIIEDTQVVPAVGTFPYNWPRENIYLQTIHGYGFAAGGGADNFSNVSLRMQQTTFLVTADPAYFDIETNFDHVGGLQRQLGVIPIDLMSTSGLGVYDLTRDTIDSSKLTDLATVITATATGTLYTVRRMLVPLQPAAAPSGA